eukprot:136361-Alexandrium_andersonii.AAC.1
MGRRTGAGHRGGSQQRATWGGIRTPQTGDAMPTVSPGSHAMVNVSVPPGGFRSVLRLFRAI